MDKKRKLSPYLAKEKSIEEKAKGHESIAFPPKKIKE